MVYPTAYNTSQRNGMIFTTYPGKATYPDFQTTVNSPAFYQYNNNNSMGINNNVYPQGYNYPRLTNIN